MRDPNPISLNTLEQALKVASLLREELERDEKNMRLLQIFAALSASYMEALIAFLIWKLKASEASAKGRVVNAGCD